MSPGFGWIPDEPDDRDYAFSMPSGATFGETPTLSGSAEHYMTPDPLDQNGHNSCVVQVLVQLIYGAHVRQGRVNPPLAARHHLWHPCRRLKGRHKDNAGTSLRTGFKVANHLGFCQEKHYPHDLSVGPEAPFRKTPPTIAQQMAHDQRKKGQILYRRIHEIGAARIDRLKRCILDGRLVGFGSGVSQAMCDDAIEPYKPIGPPEVIAGRHAMVAAAYHGDDFKVRTSWGDIWDDGYCWMNAQYVAEWADLWYVEYAPFFSELS